MNIRKLFRSRHEHSFVIKKCSCGQEYNMKKTTAFYWVKKLDILFCKWVIFGSFTGLMSSLYVMVNGSEFDELTKIVLVCVTGFSFVGSIILSIHSLNANRITKEESQTKGLGKEVN